MGSTFTYFVYFSGPFYLEELVTQRALFFYSWDQSFYGVTPCICSGYCYATSVLLPLAHNLIYCVTRSILLCMCVCVCGFFFFWCRLFFPLSSEVSSDEASFVWKCFCSYHKNSFSVYRCL
jgi:hypothetical protein